MGGFSTRDGFCFETMLRRTSIPAFSVTLLVGLSMLGNCSMATAGYLPPSLDKPVDSLFASENNGFEQATSGVAVPEASDNPLPSSDHPGGPLASRTLLTNCFGLCTGRGNSGGGGAGGANNGQNLGGSGPPLACLMPSLASLR